MKTALNLSVLFLLALVTACGDGSSGSGGNAGSGGTAGSGGAAGTGGAAGAGGQAGMSGEGGMGGDTVPKGNCHSSIPDLLSEWALFDDIRNQVPADGVVPFEVTSPLYTDAALKRRFVTLRQGGTLTYSDVERWQSPVGTIYVKTFAYPPNLEDPETDGLEQLIETRLLVHAAAEDDRLGCSGAESCWQVHAYVYEDDMEDAICETSGAVVSVEYTDPVTDEQKTVPEYGVPRTGACRDCHGAGEDTRSLGPSTGMLNRGNDYLGESVENQIDHLYDLGMLSEPEPAEDRVTYADPVALTTECQTPACVHEAARSWFDSNCAHCHAPDGEAQSTGLYLDYQNMDPEGATLADFRRWGVCRTPTSAGGVRNCGDAELDIVPGDPDSSITLCRIDSVRESEMMAPLGRSLIDEDGYAIIRQWITDLPVLFENMPTSCSSVDDIAP